MFLSLTELVPLLIQLVHISDSFIFSLPFDGVLVRLRANYNPKSTGRDVELEKRLHAGSNVDSYLRMLQRVRRVEGWAGLYKGLVPLLIKKCLRIALSSLGPTVTLRGENNVQDFLSTRHMLPRMAFETLVTLLLLPMDVLAYRAVTTSFRLPYFRPKYALRVLLTSEEWRRPWTIYFIPGLSAATVWRRVLLPDMLDAAIPAVALWRQSPAPMVFGIVATLFMNVITCPLIVIITKLATQKEALTGEVSAQSTNGASSMPSGDFSGVRLRPRDNAYRGFLHCATCTVREEGWTAFYRGWWVLWATSILSYGGFALVLWVGQLLCCSKVRRKSTQLTVVQPGSGTPLQTPESELIGHRK